MDLDEILDAAESEPESKPTRTVRICVNPRVAIRRAELLDALDRAREADRRANSADNLDDRLGVAVEETTEHTDKAAAELRAFDVEVQKSLVTITFHQLPGDLYATITSACPPRVDVPIDRQCGYNYDDATTLAARKSGMLVSEDGESEITAEQWDRLYRVITGADVAAIRDAVWTLNQWLPQKYVETLVKDSGAA